MASSNSWLPQMPALFTSRSILPKCSMVLAMRSLPPSGVETSLSSAMASPPRDRMRSATCSAIVESFPNPDTSVPKSFTTTRAPRSARSSTYARPSPNGVKLGLFGCKIACVARPGQQVVAGDRLADRIGVGVLAKVFPPELVDRAVDQAGVREQRKRTLPARVVVYYLLAMVLFFQSGYGEVWNKLVAGLDWARRFQVRLSLGMQPTPAAITLARQRLGWQVMAALLDEAAGPLAGQEAGAAFVSGMRLAAIDGLCLDVADTAENAAAFGYPGNDSGRGPFPQIRVVGLGECGTRAVLGAALSPLATGEQALARRLLGKLSPGDLHPGHRHPRSGGAIHGAGRRGLRLPLAAGDLLR